MSNGSGSKFDPDAFAKALDPAFKALGDSFGKKIDELRTELKTELRTGLTDLGTRMDTGFRELGGRIDVLGDRFEGAIENQSVHYRALEARVGRLESAVFPRKPE